MSSTKVKQNFPMNGMMFKRVNRCLTSWYYASWTKNPTNVVGFFYMNYLNITYVTGVTDITIITSVTSVNTPVSKASEIRLILLVQ